MLDGSGPGNAALAADPPVAETSPAMIDKTFEQLVTSLAARTPTPGGGAAAAMAACMGAALFVMVVRFARGRKGNEARERELAQVEGQLQVHLQRLLPMAERDCKSFDLVAAAYQMPKTGEEQAAMRERAVQEAMVGAMVVPEETLCMVRDVFQAVAGVVGCIGNNIISDLGTAAALLGAAAEGAHLNVRINATWLKNRDLAGKALDRSRAVRQEIQSHHAAIMAAVEKLLT